MENQRYDVILFDADRTLFDFDRSQLDALREVFQTHGIPATQEMMDLYIRINNHLWGQFDRGEITTEELTRVRFRLFLEEAGDQGQDPAAMNRQYLESLAATATCWMGRKRCAGSWPPTASSTSSPTASRWPRWAG